MVVDESTARLVEHEFELRDAGPQALKGIDRPIGVLRVAAPRSVATRFDAIHGQTPLEIFVGRKAELALLNQSWERAVLGEGHVVLVGGEAGIGKSRLIREFIDSIRDQPHELFRFQCSPAHLASMLHPFIDQIERRAGLRSATDDEQRLDRVEAYVSGWAGDPEETIPLVAELLKVPLDGRYAAVALSGEEHRSRTLSVLVAQFLAEANERPVVVVVEDLHWVDPTSLQLLRHLQAEVGSARVLVIGSHRSDWSIDHLDPDLVSALVLGRLATADVRRLAAAMTGGGSSHSETDDAFLSEVVERTDGIPLFVEEFTRAVMEGEGTGATPIPETLSASLMARLDRLEDAKYVAQVASVIGREFSGDLLTDVIELAPEEVDAALDRIIDAGLVRGRLVEEGTEYSFKHSLVRDAAYESLLRQDRRAIHQRVADRLAERSAAGGATEPEILALHQSEAENWEDSLVNWREAGAHAIAAGATEEAIAHLTRALDALAHLDEGADRSRSEMEILLDLAPAEMTLRGYASDRAKQLYDRAYELAREVGDENHRFITLWAGYYITEVRAQWNESRRNVDQLLDLDHQFAPARPADPDRSRRAHLLHEHRRPRPRSGARAADHRMRTTRPCTTHTSTASGPTTPASAR